MKQNLVKLAADYRRDVDKYLRELKISEKEMNLHEPMMYSATAPGKRIRPLLTLFTGTGLGADRKALLPIAVSVELLHTFTLVHDDIMDNDTQRRGLPTVHVKWDQNTAILAGDGLMALAFRVLMESRAARIRQMGYEFSQAMLEICEGQVLDMGFESRMDVNREAYLEMVGKKTGRLLGLSCQLGGLAADADEKIIHNLKVDISLNFLHNLFTKSFCLFFKVSKQISDNIKIEGHKPYRYEEQWEQVLYKVESSDVDLRKFDPLFEAAYRNVVGEK